MLTARQVAQFHRDGFLNAGVVRDAAELTELSADPDGVIAKGPDRFAAGVPRPVKLS